MVCLLYYNLWLLSITNYRSFNKHRKVVTIHFEVVALLRNLRKLREESKVTQKQLADAIGISQQSINKYENHKIEPDIHTMIQIANYFQTSVDYLVGNTEIRRKIERTHPAELNSQELWLLVEYRRLSEKKRQSIHQIVDCYNE